MEFFPKRTSKYQCDDDVYMESMFRQVFWRLDEKVRKARAKFRESLKELQKDGLIQKVREHRMSGLEEPEYLVPADAADIPRYTIMEDDAEEE